MVTYTFKIEVTVDGFDCGEAQVARAIITTLEGETIATKFDGRTRLDVVIDEVTLTEPNRR